MDVNFTLLRDHVLSDDVQICKTLVHEGCNVVCPLKNFSINVRVYEIQKLVKNFFNVADFIEVGDDK